LQIINPALNTIPYALALLAHLKEVQGISNSVGYASQSTHLASLWRKTVDFLDSFDPKQIRYIGPEAREIVIYLAAFARSLGEVCYIDSIRICNMSLLIPYSLDRPLRRLQISSFGLTRPDQRLHRLIFFCAS
jgi:hypothetical protein